MLSTLFLFTIVLSAGYAKEKSPKIVGGEETTIETYPYIVQVESYNTWTGWSQNCGANILNANWILSAAHCFEGRNYSPTFKRIRAGSSIRNSGGVVHYVDYEINHPEYRVLARYDADITIVKLLTPIVETLSVKRGTLVVHGFAIPDNYPVIHAGWGHTRFGGSPSNVLLHTQMYTINKHLCATRYQQLNGVVTPNMICAGLLDIGGRDACQGDSGGPLYASGQNGHIIVGIVSWGHRCANETYPGISTNVASYTNWVLENAL
ncbi:trypsin CFT-1-like [Pieris brassicae]|uniref:trypsin CFT-1-like n=1 Tax=Pieris brassicae TaxID=7116 RepID=UPI001E660F04|nr:trypsin CFT-1-like [Pieris brassicae]